MKFLSVFYIYSFYIAFLWFVTYCMLPLFCVVSCLLFLFILRQFALEPSGGIKVR